MALTKLNFGGSQTALTGANLPADSILQIVQGSTSTQTNMGSTSYADTGLSASITPSSTSSKVLIIINQYYTFRTTTTASRTAYFRLLGATELVQQLYNKEQQDNASEDREGKIASFNYLDSPSTTSAITYKTQFRLSGTTADLYAQHQGTTSFITLMEIAG
jgi:hypothetical protein